MPVQMHERVTLELQECGRRAADIINEKRANVPWETLAHQWIAIRLSDGGSDGILYDTRKDCVRFQKDEMRCAYIAFANLVGGASAREMALIILWWREAYAAGFRGTDPEHPMGGTEVIPHTRNVDAARQLATGMPDLDNALGADGKRLTPAEKEAFTRAWLNQLAEMNRAQRRAMKRSRRGR